MARLPNFAEPSTYIKYRGPVLTWPTQVSASDDTADKIRFIRLNAREGPLKYPRILSPSGGLAPGIVSSPTNFGDLEMLPKHIAQVFIGVSYGTRIRVNHPLNERILKWDDNSLDITEADTANIEYEDSPIDEPKYELWLAPTVNYIFQLDAENILNDVRPARSINAQILILASKYTYEFVEPEREPDLYDNLRKHRIPSRWVNFGGRI